MTNDKLMNEVKNVMKDIISRRDSAGILTEADENEYWMFNTFLNDLPNASPAGLSQIESNIAIYHDSDHVVYDK